MKQEGLNTDKCFLIFIYLFIYLFTFLSIKEKGLQQSDIIFLVYFARAKNVNKIQKKKKKNRIKLQINIGLKSQKKKAWYVASFLGQKNVRPPKIWDLRLK